MARLIAGSAVISARAGPTMAAAGILSDHQSIKAGGPHG